MLRIMVELLPSDGGPPEVLGMALIANDGTGTQERGNYTIRLFETGKVGERRGKYWGFLRQQRGPWDLVYRCLGVTRGKAKTL